jgi:acetyltransferase-like isoleucine patch superfamily enzyme
MKNTNFLTLFKRKLILTIRKILWRVLGFSNNKISRITFGPEQNLKKLDWVEIGRRSYDNGAFVWRESKNQTLKIGAFCSIAEDVYFLCGAGRHDMKTASTYSMVSAFFDEIELVKIGSEQRERSYWDEKLSLSKGPIIVGNDVWIGYRAIILSGVNIGNGAVIYADSLVSKDVPPYAIVAGIPAKIVGFRFDPKTIDKLSQIAWWNWPDEIIKSRIEDFLLPGEVFANKYDRNDNFPSKSVKENA